MGYIRSILLYNRETVPVPVPVHRDSGIRFRTAELKNAKLFYHTTCVLSDALCMYMSIENQT